MRTLRHVTEEIVEQVATVLVENKLDIERVGEGLGALHRLEALPTSIARAGVRATDTVHRLAWLVWIRGAIGQEVDLNQGPGTVDWLVDTPFELVACELLKWGDSVPAPAARRALPVTWRHSANALEEVMAWRGDDLALLVRGPIADWRGDAGAIEPLWLRASGEARLLLEHGPPLIRGTLADKGRDPRRADDLWRACLDVGLFSTLEPPQESDPRSAPSTSKKGPADQSAD